MIAIKLQARRGILINEALVALVVLAGAAVLVAQFATWSLSERARTDARLDATDAAANILERARAQPWKDLGPAWASSQRLSEQLAARWPDCKMAVQVEPEDKHPTVKRVTVEIKWTNAGRVGWLPVKMSALFADRAEEAKP